MLRIHASYHKCLTMLFYRTMNQALNSSMVFKKQKYRHFESIEGMFYNLNHNYLISSINGFAPKFERFNRDFRITRFIRDPRDLIISGYFYHKKGSEPWFRLKRPDQKYWYPINACLPESMPEDLSYAEYLQSISMEEGLKIEMEFRKFHFQSMKEWPKDKRVKLFRYEDIINDQVSAFEEIVDHYEIVGITKSRILRAAKRFALQNRDNDNHIRNANSEQWRKYFSKEMNDLFLSKYEDILELYQYQKY